MHTCVSLRPSILPELSEELPTFATNCMLVGHAQKADVVWTERDFLALCEHMMNGSEANFFMIPYRDKNGVAKFAKAWKPRAEKHARWAWDTITGRAKTPASIGFYPRNKNGNSRWAALDFDAHDGEDDRARTWAIAAFQLLYRHPQLFIVLATSGGGGWHLFIFTQEFHPVDEWTKLLKQVAAVIGADIQKGSCEIFPSETRGNIGYGIRAPGAWNPKHDCFGLVAFQNVKPLCEAKGGIKGYPFINRLTPCADGPEFTYGEKKPVYRGEGGKWKKQFAIIAPRTRRDKLKALVDHIFRQVNRATARVNAELIYHEANPTPSTLLGQHMTDFDELWQWHEETWVSELSASEREKFDLLITDNERSAFRVARGFAKAAREVGEDDFKFHCESMAARLGITLPGVAKIRDKLSLLRAIKKTADYVPCKLAARFQWTADKPQEPSGTSENFVAFVPPTTGAAINEVNKHAYEHRNHTNHNARNDDKTGGTGERKADHRLD
jgi:hypothetical protein